MKLGEKVKLRANLPQHKVEEMMEIGIVPGREYYVAHVRWVDGVDFLRLKEVGNTREYLLVGAKWFVPVDNAVEWRRGYKKPTEEDTGVNIFSKIGQLFDDALSKLDEDAGVWDFTNPTVCSEQKFRDDDFHSTDEQWDRLEKFLDGEDAREFYREFDFDDPKGPLVTLGKDQLIALMVAFKKATRHKDGRPLRVCPEE